MSIILLLFNNVPIYSSKVLTCFLRWVSGASLLTTWPGWRCNGPLATPVVDLIPGTHQQACTNNSHQRRPAFQYCPYLPGIIIAEMRTLVLLSVVSLCIGQTNFGATSSKQNPNSSSDVNTRIFTGPGYTNSSLLFFVSFKYVLPSFFLFSNK